MIRPFLFQRLALAAVVVASVLASRSAAAQDYKPGDRVTVIHWDVKFEASGKSVGETELGDNYTVDRVDGNWLWVKNERGFLRASDVRPYDDAMAYFTDRVRTEADSTAYHDRGCAWLEREEYDIAIGDFNDALRLNDDAATYVCRGNAWDSNEDYDSAIADYNEAIRLDPSKAMYFNNRGNTWMDKGDLDKALADYNEAIRLDPTYFRAYYGRGCVWTEKGDLDKAIADGTEAIRLAPTNACYLAGRGCDYQARGDIANAVADYRAAVKLDPSEVCRLNCLAWKLATSPNANLRDAELAVELALDACELTTYSDLNFLDTLAAAYAEAGDFEHAVEWQTKARDFASEDEQSDFQSRLDLYVAGQPYHAPAPTGTADAPAAAAAPVAAVP